MFGAGYGRSLADSLPLFILSSTPPIIKGPAPWLHSVLSAWDVHGNEKSKDLDHEQSANRGYSGDPLRNTLERLELCAFPDAKMP